MSSRPPISETHLIRFGAFEVDLHGWVLRTDNKRVPLQKKPFQILRLLLSRPGELVSRAELAHELWPELHVTSERCLNTAVNALRNALDDPPRQSRFIQTRPGLGYCFEGLIDPCMPPDKMLPNREKQLDLSLGYHFLHRFSSDSLARARACFNAALQGSEHTLAANVALSELECLTAVCGCTPTKNASRRALLHAQAAQSIDPRNMRVQIAMSVAAALSSGWHKEAIRLCSSALHPSTSETPTQDVVAQIWLAEFLCSCGRANEAVEHLQNAQRANPISLLVRSRLSLASYLDCDYEAAIEQAWAALSIEPACAEAQLDLAMAYQQLDNVDDAIVEFENAVACSGGSPAALAGLCHALHKAGRLAESLQVAARVNELSKSAYVPYCWRALVQLASGKGDAARQSLTLAVRAGDHLLGFAKYDPRFASINVMDIAEEAMQRNMRPWGFEPGTTGRAGWARFSSQ